MRAKANNLCGNCAARVPATECECGRCGAATTLDTAKSMGLWRMGPVAPKFLAPISRELSRRLGVPFSLHPAGIDPAPAVRKAWKGLSANVFLSQVDARTAEGGTSLGITSSNITPGKNWNFVFGLGYMPGKAAVVSLFQLERAFSRATSRIVDGAVKLALHELGHCAGLDHHEYDDGIDCLMCGNADEDSVQHVDKGPDAFCRKCARVFRKHAWVKR